MESTLIIPDTPTEHSLPNFNPPKPSRRQISLAGDVFEPSSPKYITNQRRSVFSVNELSIPSRRKSTNAGLTPCSPDLGSDPPAPHRQSRTRSSVLSITQERPTSLPIELIELNKSLRNAVEAMPEGSYKRPVMDAMNAVIRYVGFFVMNTAEKIKTLEELANGVTSSNMSTNVGAPARGGGEFNTLLGGSSHVSMHTMARRASTRHGVTSADQSNATNNNNNNAPVSNMKLLRMTLTSAVEQITHLLKCESVSVFVFDENSNQMASMVSGGTFPGGLSRRIRIPVDSKHAVCSCYESSLAINITDNTLKKSAMDHHSLLCIPIMDGSLCSGVLSAVTKYPVGAGVFTNWDESIAFSFSAMLSSVLKSNRSVAPLTIETDAEVNYLFRSARNVSFQRLSTSVLDQFPLVNETQIREEHVVHNVEKEFDITSVRTTKEYIAHVEECWRITRQRVIQLQTQIEQLIQKEKQSMMEKATLAKNLNALGINMRDLTRGAQHSEDEELDPQTSIGVEETIDVTQTMSGVTATIQLQQLDRQIQHKTAMIQAEEILSAGYAEKEPKFTSNAEIKAKFSQQWEKLNRVHEHEANETLHRQHNERRGLLAKTLIAAGVLQTKRTSF
eukprot:PhF_6_TR22749/c0_g1_i1/m.32432